LITADPKTPATRSKSGYGALCISTQNRSSQNEDATTKRRAPQLSQNLDQYSGLVTTDGNDATKLLQAAFQTALNSSTKEVQQSRGERKERKKDASDERIKHLREHFLPGHQNNSFRNNTINNADLANGLKNSAVAQSNTQYEVPVTGKEIK
jgi:hypothetical protein